MTMTGEFEIRPTPLAGTFPIPPASATGPAQRVSSRTRASSRSVMFGLVTTRDGFLALHDDWRDLETRAGTKFNYFQTFDWNWNWYNEVADRESHELLILTVRRHGRLAMVWPLMIEREAGLRTVKWLSEPYLQYGDVLIEPGEGSGDLLTRAWNHLQRLPAFELLMLNKVLNTANAYPLLKAHCQTAINASVASQLNISGYRSPRDYDAGLGRTRRRRHKQRRNKLARQGRELTFKVHEPGPDFDKAVETALSFKRDWLVNSGLLSRSIFAPKTEGFLTSLSSQGAQGARAVAAELKLDGRTIAVETGFVFKSHYYAYLGAFDWDLRQFSPGKVQMHDMISWCIDNGITHYDLLGSPATYKSEWTDESIEMHDFCTARSARAGIYLRLWLGRMRPLAKDTFERLAPAKRRALVKLKDFVSKPFAVRQRA